MPTMFLPFMQTSAPLTLGAMYVVARTNVVPAAVTAALRGVVADVDRDVPVSRMKTQTDQIQESLATEFAFTRRCSPSQRLPCFSRASACTVSPHTQSHGAPARLAYALQPLDPANLIVATVIMRLSLAWPPMFRRDEPCGSTHSPRCGWSRRIDSTIDSLSDDIRVPPVP